MKQALTVRQALADLRETCNACGCFDEQHDCAMVLLGRARWLILHYAARFNDTDKPEALAFVEQSALLLAKHTAEQRDRQWHAEQARES